MKDPALRVEHWPVTVGDGDGLGAGDAEGDGPGDAVADGDGEADALADGDALTDGDGEAPTAESAAIIGMRDLSSKDSAWSGVPFERAIPTSVAAIAKSKAGPSVRNNFTQ